MTFQNLNIETILLLAIYCTAILLFVTILIAALASIVVESNKEGKFGPKPEFKVSTKRKFLDRT